MAQPHETLRNQSSSLLSRRNLFRVGGALGTLAVIQGVESLARRFNGNTPDTSPTDIAYERTLLSKDSYLAREATQNFKKLSSPDSAVTNDDMFNAVADFFDKSGAEDELQIHLSKDAIVFLGHHENSETDHYAYVDFMDKKVGSNMFFGFKKLKDGSIQPYDSDFELSSEDGDFPIGLDQRGLRVIASGISNGLIEARDIEIL